MPKTESDQKGASVRQVLDLLTATRLMQAGDVEALRATWTGSKLDSDGGELARNLVRTGKLTKYQAAAVYQNQAKALGVGDYLFLDRLGGGGAGTVYKARWRDGGPTLALKVLNSASSRSADAVKRFRREADAAVRLNHPGITRAIEAGEAEGRLFLVMELLDGLDLSTYVKQHGPLPIDEAVGCVAAAADALAYAHAAGIVHRDVKPANLFLTRAGTVKLLDLGLARLDDAAGGDELTQTGQVMGTVDYMAPEQALHTRLADKRADVYGLGCTLYRIATGELPYGGESLVEKILAHREHPIPSLRTKNPAVKPATDAVLRRMLAKNPDDRYQSMDEVANALRQSLADPPSAEAGSATLPANGSPTSAPSFQATPVAPPSPPNLTAIPVDDRLAKPVFLLAYGAAALVLLVVGTVAWRLMNRGSSSEPGSEQPDIAARASDATGSSISPAPVMSPTSKGTGGTGPIVSGEVEPPKVAISPSPSPPNPSTASPADRPGNPIPSSAAGSPMSPPNGPSAGGAIAAVNARPSPSTAPSPTAISGATGTASPSPVAVATALTRPVATATASAAAPLSTPQSSATATGTAATAVGAIVAAPPAAPKHAVPDAAKLAAAVKVIRTELFNKEYAQLGGPAEAARLAGRLLEQAKSLGGDPVGRYAMLCEARDLSLQAVDMSKAEEAAQAVVSAYEVERLPWLAEGVATAADRLNAGPVVRQLAGEVWLKIDEALKAGTREPAYDLIEAGGAAARKSQDPSLIRLFAEREKKAAKERSARDAAYRMRDQVAAKPADPAANTGWGKYLCYVMNDWEHGLQHLARGNDAVLKELAQKGLPPPTDTDGRIAVGDLWWNRADRMTNPALKGDLILGAAYWYQTALPTAPGLTRKRLEKRIDEARSVAKAAAAFDPTLPTYVALPVSPLSPLYLRLIEPGGFTMGSPQNEPSRDSQETQHTVLLTKPIYLGVTEVTIEQWRAIGGKMPTNVAGDPTLPITNVSRNDMELVFQTLNRSPYGLFLRFRLPTEAEWEYAARAGTSGTYYWGNEMEPAGHAFAVFSLPTGTRAKRVGGCRPNAWGLYDMLGNCWEPCADFYDTSPYGIQLAIDPAKLLATPTRTQSFVQRGGCAESTIRTFRTAFRGNGTTMSSGLNLLGLRFACDIIGKIPPSLGQRDAPQFTLSPEAAAVSVGAP